MCLKGHSDSLVRKDNHIMYEGEMVEKELEAYGTSIVILVSCHYPHPAGGVTMGDRAPQLLQPWQYTGPL